MQSSFVACAAGSPLSRARLTPLNVRLYYDQWRETLPVPGAHSVVRHDGLLGARYLTGIDALQSALRTPYKQAGGTLLNGVTCKYVNGFRANQKGVSEARHLTTQLD